MLQGEGEVKLNPEALQELERNHSLSAPKPMLNKPWMDFDTSLPVVPQAPAKKVVLTLRPYTAHTKYNWDPVYQKKITVDKDTWRRNHSLSFTLHASTLSGVGAAAPSGLDFMKFFTREFWDVKGRKRRARTLEALKAYGDSITAFYKASCQEK